MVLLLLGAMGCSSNAGQADAKIDCDFTLQWGTRSGADFSPFTQGADAEITLGFQGFRYIDSSVKLVDMAAEQATLSFQIAVTGHEPWAQSFGAPIYTDGAFVDVLVFFNDIPVPELIGRSTQITARAVANGCLGSYDTTVTLKDDDNCLETDDGGLSCAADGGQ